MANIKIKHAEIIEGSAFDLHRIEFSDGTNFEITERQVKEQIEKANSPDTQKAILVAKLYNRLTYKVD